VYDIKLSESFFPAQAGEPQHLMTIGQMLSRSADDHPNQAALKELLADGSIGRVWSYSELLHDAEGLARALSTRHAEGARVTVFAGNIPEWQWPDGPE
jgi:fatty-acyl-CoA synthase